MTAWYKKPNYDGSGITKQINLKKGYGDISKIAPLVAAGLASVATEAAKPIAQNLGQRASNHIDKKGINIPITGIPIGPRLKIGGDKKMEKADADSLESLIAQQNFAAKQGNKSLAATLATKIANLRTKQFETPEVQQEIARDKMWREGRQNKYGKMEKELPTDAMTMTNKSLVKSIDTFLLRKGILQKTANKSSLPLGTYQKAGTPVKRMVNNSATVQSPDVWSAGKKTTKTKE